MTVNDHLDSLTWQELKTTVDYLLYALYCVSNNYEHPVDVLQGLAPAEDLYDQYTKEQETPMTEST
jgi:hypothetical protein